MKTLILLRLGLVSVLLISSLANAATVVLEAAYPTASDVPAGNYSFIVSGLAVETGDIAQFMTTTLLNQDAGDYTAVISVCNEFGCNDKSTSYTIPDVPNVDAITLTITVSKD